MAMNARAARALAERISGAAQPRPLHPPCAAVESTALETAWRSR
jgi:hypothetical protein